VWQIDASIIYTLANLTPFMAYFEIRALELSSKNVPSPQISPPVAASLSTDIETDLTCSKSPNPRMEWETKGRCQQIVLVMLR
jgi:hypothetical protein